MKRNLIVLSLLALFVAATAVVAEEHMHMTSHEMGEVIEALQLTPAQQAVWESAHQEFKTTAQPLFEKQRTLGRQIESELKSKSADPCAVGGELIAQQAVKDQISALHEQLKGKVAAVLTPEQKTKLEAIASMHERHAGMLEHHQ